jgi:hypothetical protein
MAYLGQAVAFTRFSEDNDLEPTNGDSNPTAVLQRNGEATAETVTVTTTATTGQFKYAFTIPGEWSVGDTVAVSATHVIDSVTKKAIIWESEIKPTLAAIRENLLRTGVSYRHTNDDTSAEEDVTITEAP